MHPIIQILISNFIFKNNMNNTKGLGKKSMEQIEEQKKSSYTKYVV